MPAEVRESSVTKKVEENKRDPLRDNPFRGVASRRPASYFSGGIIKLGNFYEAVGESLLSRHLTTPLYVKDRRCGGGGGG